MPAESETIDITEELSPDEPREIGTPLKEIFAKAMPGGDPDYFEKQEQEKEPEKKSKKEPVQKEEKKKSEKKEEPAVERKVPDSLFEDELKKVEPEEPPIEIPAAIKSGEARKHFETVEIRARDAEKRAKAAEKLAAERETKLKDVAPNELVKNLEAQNKDLLSRLERAGLEHHPWFEQQITIPRQNALGAAQKAFESAGGDPKALASALRLDGQARANRLDELFAEITSPTLKGKVERAVDAVENIESRREQILQNRDTVMKRLQDQDKVNQHQWLEQQKKTVEENLEEATRVLRDEFKIPVFKKTDDPKYAWWNEEVDKMESESKKIMLETDNIKELAIASKLAVAFPRVYTMFQQERKARIAAEKRADDYSESEPKIGGGDRKRPSSNGEEEEDEGLTVSEAIIKRMHKSEEIG